MTASAKLTRFRDRATARLARVRVTEEGRKGAINRILARYMVRVYRAEREGVE